MVTIEYATSSSKECGELEEAMNKFKHAYIIRCTGAVIASKSLASIVSSDGLVIDVHPANDCKISEVVYRAGGEIIGKIIKASPKACAIKIDTAEYYINFAPKN